MGVAAEQLFGVVARRRPDKALRDTGDYNCNLGVFDMEDEISLASDVAATEFNYDDVESDVKELIGEDHHESTQFVESDPNASGRRAANSDSTQADIESEQTSEGNYRPAIAVTGCLWVAVLCGYLWSLSINSEPDIADPDSTIAENLPAEAAAITSPSIQIKANSVIESPVTGPAAAASTGNANAAEWAYREEEYLEEINWLTNQNNELKLEVFDLRQESLDLNNELLQLELEVVSMRFQLEKTVETRIVYNFVDVPIGSQQTLQSSSRASFANNNPIAAGRTSPSVENRLGLQTSNPETDEGFMSSDERFVNTYDQYVDENGEFMEEAFLADQQHQDMLDSYNGGEPANTELGYDPETGFYINDQYLSDETQFEVDEVDSIWPPIGSQ
ncbi:MAG: hypothetical protein AB8B64_06680 [Granulosicoccus sp.]